MTSGMIGLTRLERDLKTLYSKSVRGHQPLSEKALVEIQKKGGEVDLLDPMFAPTIDGRGRKVPSQAALRASILARLAHFSRLGERYSGTELKITADHLDRPGATTELADNLKSIHEYAKALLDNLTQKLGWIGRLRREDFSPDAARRLREQMKKERMSPKDVAKFLQNMHRTAQANGYWHAEPLATTFRDFFEPSAKEIEKALRERLLGADYWKGGAVGVEESVERNVAELKTALSTGCITPKEYDQALLDGYYRVLASETVPAGVSALEAEIPPERIDVKRQKTAIREGLLKALHEERSFRYGLAGNEGKLAFLDHLSAHKDLLSDAELTEAVSSHIPNILSWAYASSWDDVRSGGFRDALFQAGAVVKAAASLLETPEARGQVGEALVKGLTDLIGRYDGTHGHPVGMAAIAQAMPGLTAEIVTDEQVKQLEEQVADGLERCAPQLLLYATWPHSGVDSNTVQPYLDVGAATPEDIQGCVLNLLAQGRRARSVNRESEADGAFNQALRLLPEGRKPDGGAESEEGSVRFAHVDLAQVLRDPQNFDFKGETIDAIVEAALEKMGPVAVDERDVGYAIRSASSEVRGGDDEADVVWSGYEQAIYRAINKATGLEIGKR